ncbi:hypothetical protein ACFMJX_29895, partial [Acinetobacter baumannii]
VLNRKSLSNYANAYWQTKCA